MPEEELCLPPTGTKAAAEPPPQQPPAAQPSLPRRRATPAPLGPRPRLRTGLGGKRRRRERRGAGLGAGGASPASAGEWGRGSSGAGAFQRALLGSVAGLEAAAQTPFAFSPGLSPAPPRSPAGVFLRVPAGGGGSWKAGAAPGSGAGRGGVGSPPGPRRGGKWRPYVGDGNLGAAEAVAEKVGQRDRGAQGACKSEWKRLGTGGRPERGRQGKGQSPDSGWGREKGAAGARPYR